MQIMNPENCEEIANLSIKCLSCIYKNDDQAAQQIDQHRRKLIDLCIQRFKVSGKFKTGQSVGSYITCLKEERANLMEFFIALFNSS